MDRPVSRILPLLVVAAALSPGAKAAPPPASYTPRMRYIDNGTIRLGVDLNIGGAIAYLSPSGSDRNVVNNHDWGRQIQMSYYSGPVPYTAGALRPAKHWEGLGWNPIQAGDDFGHGSRVIEEHSDATSLSVTCVPMQWPLDGVPAECTFTCRIRLEGPAARVHCRLENRRSDPTQYPARHQELPALYTNGPYCRLMSYTGDRPFEGEPPRRLDRGAGGTFPWISWTATESWAALVDEGGWGLGIWAPGSYHFIGGFAGTPGAGGSRDTPTGYIAPVRTLVIDHNIRHEYEYALVLGSLAEIRRFVGGQPRPAPAPSYIFADDRQGWYPVNTRDEGWPVRGAWQVRLEGNDPQLVGPAGFWKASEAPTLRIRAAFRTDRGDARVFWATLEEPTFSEARSLPFAIVGDGRERTVEVDLSRSPGYRGAITGLRIDPVSSGDSGAWARVVSIVLAGPVGRPAAP